jgi:hypothetical protein
MHKGKKKRRYFKEDNKLVTPLDAKTQNLGMMGSFSPNCHKPILVRTGM